MRKIEYPKNIDKFKQDYLSIFDLNKLQKEWTNLRIKNKVFECIFPSKVSRILLADYRRLVKYYLSFKNKFLASSKISETDKNTLTEQIKKIFNYDHHYQKLISAFFMEHAVDLNISVCNYCETSYINAYKIDRDSEYLNTINNASTSDLSKKLQIKSQHILAEISKLLPLKSIDYLASEGIKNKWWRNKDKIRLLFPKYKNHFDIDHVLDKGTCPLVGLSLMNFVPSCQVCNQRLKKIKVLGDRIRNIPKAHLSPSSGSFDFDEKVKFIINPIPKNDGSLPNPADAIDDRDFFELDLVVKDSDFVDFIEIFYLKERYNFHKTEGLYWIQQKERYTDANIDMMVNGLKGIPGMTKDRIKEDIFRKEYDKIRKSCFLKLKNDCLSP